MYTYCLIYSYSTLNGFLYVQDKKFNQASEWRSCSVDKMYKLLFKTHCNLDLIYKGDLANKVLASECMLRQRGGRHCLEHPECMCSRETEQSNGSNEFNCHNRITESTGAWPPIWTTEAWKRITHTQIVESLGGGIVLAQSSAKSITVWSLMLDFQEAPVSMLHVPDLQYTGIS